MRSISVQIGQRVVAQETGFNADSSLYQLGEVATIHKDKTYTVRFEDGTERRFLSYGTSHGHRLPRLTLVVMADEDADAWADGMAQGHSIERIAHNIDRARASVETAALESWLIPLLDEAGWRQGTNGVILSAVDIPAERTATGEVMLLAVAAQEIPGGYKIQALVLLTGSGQQYQRGLSYLSKPTLAEALHFCLSNTPLLDKER